MKQKRPKKSHQYDVDFLFENDRLDTWEEVLAWEEANNFTGARSRIWSKSDHDVYFYYLIECNNNDFINRIPMDNHFHQGIKKTHTNENLFHVAARHAKDKTILKTLQRFISHTFSHAPLLLVEPNNNGHTPLALAIKEGNILFILEIKKLMQQDESVFKHMKDFFMLFSDQDDKRIDIYTWAKNHATHEIQALLFQMGALLFSKMREEQILEDFKEYYPDQDPQQAPFSSPSLFQQAIRNSHESGSSRSTAGMLQGSNNYWASLLESAISVHGDSLLATQKLNALLFALEDDEPLPTNEAYLALIDQLIFALRTEEIIAKNQESHAVWKGLNPLRRFFEWANKYSKDIYNGIVGSTALIVYIYLMYYFIENTLENHHQYKDLQKTIRNTPGCEEVKCGYWQHPNHWPSCCPPGNPYEECAQWPSNFDDCQSFRHDFTTFRFGAIWYGLLGLQGNVIAASFSTIIIFILGSIINMILGPIHFTSDNQAAVHEKLKNLVALFKEHCAFFVEGEQAEADLALIDKPLNELTHEEFIKALGAMNRTIANYHTQVNFLHTSLQLTRKELTSSIEELPSFVRENDSIHSDHASSALRIVLGYKKRYDKDIEAGLPEEEIPLIAQSKRSSCIIL